MIQDSLEYIGSSILSYGFLAFLFAAILSFYFVPTIRKLAMSKNLTDSPSSRKSHTAEVPVLGGVAIYLASAFSIFIVAYLFPSKIETSAFFLLAFGSMTLLFVGVVDDIVGLKPLHKLTFQLIVSFVLIHNTPLYINHMNGLFGFSEIAYISSLLLSVFVYVVFINMLNIIDGIDGLASGISVVAFLFFAYVSFFEFYYFNMLVSMAGVGCLLPFMYYNIFSDKKVFLGDNGSLVMGVILGYLSLDYIHVDTTTTELLFGGNKIVILMSLFSYPLVDTLRVFLARILRKKSPFSADKNHIHHHLLRLGLSHRRATLLILVYTCFITCVSFSMKNIDINITFFILLILAVTIICIPSFLIKNDAGSVSLRKRA